jgi:hypothetical protein
MGRSNCKIPTTHYLTNEEINQHQVTTFLCEESGQNWITEEGWYELLRQFVGAAKLKENSEVTWEILWLYIPDFLEHGKMNTIQNVPKLGHSFSVDDPDPFWQQTESCAGSKVSDDCPWRFEEMLIVTFTP